MFLRALFDAEGYARKKEVEITNTNLVLLFYIREILKKYFGIITTRPYVIAKKGGPRHKKDCYRIAIYRKESKKD
jgi:hypothetical protein